MTACIAVTATIVALAAAARSTWSPCGLSMLSTITPLGERARGHSYRSSAGWFVLGATVGGATLGAAMALLAAGADRLHLSPAVLGATALGAALVAAASDSGVVGRRLPIHRRQVNERWLDHYRSWVYAGGFGWQIGTGLSTYITTAAVYLMVVLAALTTGAAFAFAVGTCFGLLRGLAVLLTRRLSSPEELLAFHRRFAAAGPRVGRVVVAVEVVVSVALAVSLGSPLAAGMVGGAVVVAVSGLVSHRSREGDVAGAPGSPERGTASPVTAAVPTGRS